MSDGKDPQASEIKVFSKDPLPNGNTPSDPEAKGKGKDDSKDEPDIVRGFDLIQY